jgi:hypothetical protein
MYSDENRAADTQPRATSIGHFHSAMSQGNRRVEAPSDAKLRLSTTLPSPNSVQRYTSSMKLSIYELSQVQPVQPSKANSIGGDMKAMETHALRMPDGV